MTGWTAPGSVLPGTICRIALTTFLVVCPLTFQTLFAQDKHSDPPAPNAADNTFEDILRSQSLKTLLAVNAYAESNPTAADYPAACEWLFKTARMGRHEQLIGDVAAAVIDNDKLDASLRRAALEVHCIALARDGKTAEAITVFEQLLKSVQIRRPDSSIALARSLANEVQMAGDFKSPKSIFESLSTAFFLNGFVRDMSNRQVEKYKLLGKPAPPIDGEDINGEPVSVSKLKGKVVLVDFWATNCPPCLEEFPKLKQTYKRLHSKGFEIVGVSLDEAGRSVSQFQKTAKLPWPLLLNDDLDPRPTKQFNVKKIPSLFLIDRKGNIAAVDVRGVDFEPAVLRLLGSPTTETQEASH